MRGGKSGQRRTRQSLTATGGDPRESATETKLPLIISVRNNLQLDDL